MNVRRLIIPGILLVLAGLVFFTFSQYYETKVEHIREMNDLQNMRGAEATALLRCKNAQLEPGEYWYSAADWDLLDLTQSKPAPYGMGTRRSGHALETFYEETGISYDYDEKMDYTDMILHLIVDRDASDQVFVRMLWE